MSEPTDTPAPVGRDAIERARRERPGAIDARPVPHPWRWVAVLFIVILGAMMISSFVTNKKWDWGFAVQVFQYKPVLRGLLMGTIVCTVGSMILGVTLGVLLAVWRLSKNPILRGAAFAYTWFFRSIPRYVLLIVLGSGLLYLYPKLDFGLPFAQQIQHLMGMQDHMTIWSLDVRTISNGIVIGILGLGLSEAAYMAEIARAGILSVDPGQTEAAQAIGMSSGKTMRRIVLPQAMRVIVPPTGNETIAMVKDTSLLSAVPITNELWAQVNGVANTTYKIMPAYVAGLVWYLIICSILMVGQSWLERRFGRGFGTKPTRGKAAKRKSEAETILGRTGEH